MSLKSFLTGAALFGFLLPASADTGLNFFFSKNSFNTISGTKGNEYAHSSGFTITNNDGVELYSSNSPGGGTPCAAFGGTKLVLKSSCIVDTITFNCASDQYGHIETCKGTYANGYEYPGGVKDEQKFIGIAITDDSICGAWADTALDCTPDTPFTLEDASWPSD